MGVSKQILADVLEEMRVAAEDRDVTARLAHQLGRGGNDRAAQVAHDRARQAEAGHHFA